VVGLGNPGSRYERTRHNAGFMVLDGLAARWDLSASKGRFRSRLAQGRAGLPAADWVPGAPGTPTSRSIVLLWPQTYMNEAGRSVGPARGHFKVDLQRVLVVHDDIDLQFGDVRVRCGGGTGGHNGLKSLTGALGGADFWRLRLGVGRPPSTDPEVVSAYVLAPFSEPAPEVAELLQRGMEAAEKLVLGEVQAQV
jgi:PTH1 family peptidyl-tRNA hydrolase